ncbi:hypothetical protein ACFVDI_15915 [Nocardioides sp. NPDC057767]|uniref:hypothetical protein n=1 Tax=unclassified Nocardioides TaxID=2615069 RepID=UPI003671D316
MSTRTAVLTDPDTALPLPEGLRTQIGQVQMSVTVCGRDSARLASTAGIRRRA